MNNHEYCVHRALQRARTLARPLRVLDYGCGVGTCVRALRSSGIDAYGCDVFYGGGCAYPAVPLELRDTIIRRMDGPSIPFDDASFDLIVDNQVLEHVEDLCVTAAEMRRVLRPGGAVLSLFPDRGVWWESHSLFPFAHWFPRGSRARERYLVALFCLGFGTHRPGATPRESARRVCAWLDAWTHYRTADEVHRAFAAHFRSIEHHEDEWLDRRADGTRWAVPVHVLPPIAKRAIARKLSGVVMTCEA